MNPKTKAQHALLVIQMHISAPFLCVHALPFRTSNAVSSLISKRANPVACLEPSLQSGFPFFP